MMNHCLINIDDMHQIGLNLKNWLFFFLGMGSVIKIISVTRQVTFVFCFFYLDVAEYIIIQESATLAIYQGEAVTCVSLV